MIERLMILTLEVVGVAGGVVGLAMLLDEVRHLRDPYRDFSWKCVASLLLGALLTIGGIKAVGMAWADINHSTTVNILINVIKEPK